MNKQNYRALELMINIFLLAAFAFIFMKVLYF